MYINNSKKMGFTFLGVCCKGSLNLPIIRSAALGNVIGDNRLTLLVQTVGSSV